MARLKIAFRGAETVVALAGERTTVGRSNRCTITLPDPALADVHFRIDRGDDGGFRLRDDGTGAGTRVNGRPVYATALGHGDVIEAGALLCVFLEGEDAPAAALPAKR
ncbi:MAG: FHA domain-containing protein, partial [Planctomycetota bacterium]